MPSQTDSNVLLRTLSADDSALLQPHFEWLDLPQRHVLERPWAAIEHLYFPVSGLASIVASAGRDKRSEVGVFGREGMSGMTIVLENDVSPFECFMQVRGVALRISSEKLHEAVAASPTLRGKFLHYTSYMLVQITQTAVVNAQSSLEERLCRWLLMCHDRMAGDKHGLTHEFLSVMLGVRRAGVTVAVHLLEGRGLVRATRGCIEIIDREGIEACADGIYGLPEAEYERLLGVSPREWLS